ncbi:lipopolysaccharide biosynthesis protein [Marinilabiliaceae bacterium JC040]|nr:lipopolysaccharide biosynthesis protein [Marinilabiliaceae bacterium JC040]
MSTKENLRNKTILGLIWSTIERLGYSLVMFITNVFLARLLMPEDFGSIALLLVFISLANIIVESGFSSALIQKKDINKKDCDTVFLLNLILSIFVYLIIYFIAPYVASFYSLPELTNLLRILSLSILINSFGIVQLALLKKDIELKKISIISICSSFLGGIVGIGAAFQNFGPWSLVYQMLTASFIRVVLINILSNWRPSFIFSYNSFISLYKYGSMVFFTRIIDVIYQNTIPLLLGKFFNPKIVGNYNQAKSLESVPNQTIITILNQVTFPVFSIIQNDEDKLKDSIQKSMKILSWINFPIMIVLIIIARPLFILLYTDKWIEAVPFFQIMCFGGMFNFIVQINLSLLLALGYSKLGFFSRLYRQLVFFILIFIGIFLDGINGLLIMGFIIFPFVSILITIYYVLKVFNYSFKEQFNDIVRPLFLSVLIGVLVFALPLEVNNLFVIILLKSIIYIFSYLFLSKLFKLDSYIYIKTEFKRFNLKQ